MISLSAESRHVGKSQFSQLWVPICLFFSIVVLSTAYPAVSEVFLNFADSLIRNYMPSWYIFIVGLVSVICAVCALIPKFGRLKLGGQESTPQYSLFAWFSMLFCSAIGISMFTWSVAEPMHHFRNNPEVIKGIVEPATAANLIYAYKWSYLHWGYSAWSVYALCALAFGYQSGRNKKAVHFPGLSSSNPVNTPDSRLSYLLCSITVLTAILSVAYTLGYGVQHLMQTFSQATELLAVPQQPTQIESGSSNIVQYSAIAIVIGIVATLSAGSGVARGIKWLSILTMVLSVISLCLFLVFGSTSLTLVMLFNCIVDYVVNLPALLVTLFISDATETGRQLIDWQEMWSVWHWAWWISFAPTVGFFLARISVGRTIRQFVLGAVVLPALLCFTWFTVLGGTAIDLEMRGIAEGVISTSSDHQKIFSLLQIIFSPLAAQVVSMLVFVVMILFLLTSLDSGLFAIAGISTNNKSEKYRTRPKVLLIALLVFCVIALNADDCLRHIRTAMLVSAFAFSPILLLMSISVVLSIYRDSHTEGPLQNTWMGSDQPKALN